MKLQRLGFGITLSELHIHYKPLLTRVYDHAGCKENCKNFTVTLQMLDAFNKQQMYNNVITGKQNASEDWNCITSMFLTSFNIYFACGYACLTCICLNTAIWPLWEKTWLFWWRQVGMPTWTTCHWDLHIHETLNSVTEQMCSVEHKALVPKQWDYYVTVAINLIDAARLGDCSEKLIQFCKNNKA